MWYLMWNAFTKILQIQQTMKYQVRNWKYTRKARRILKLRKKCPTTEEVKICEKLYDGISKVLELVKK